MVNKTELLKDLKGYLTFEEEVVPKLSSFYQALGWRKIVKEHCRREIERGLIHLKKDTEKHARMISGMIKYVEESGKNEF